MNLAYKYPIIFWNTANLIVDSAGISYDDNDEADDNIESEEITEEEPEETIVDIYEPEEWEEYEYEDLPDRSGKKKKKTKSVDFGKIATAIGKFQTQGIKILPPDINKSGFTFTPDVEHNSIASGLRNITRISADYVNKIIENRPYTSLEDFMNKVKSTKVQILNLLKCGCFDNLYQDRKQIVYKYVESIAGKKSNLTLANIPLLMKYNILDEECEKYCKLFSFNKFLRSNMDEDKLIITIPTDKALEYYCNNFDIDLLLSENTILVKAWEKQYKNAIAPFSIYLKEEKENLLNKLNNALIEEAIGENVSGSISHWEMESISCYFHEHELNNIDNYLFDIVDYNRLPETPIISNTFEGKDNSKIVLYELHHICGTVLNKNKLKNTVTLLTPSGVVNVKIYKNQFAKYDKQLSEIGSDGHKHVIEKSWFTRGNLLYIQGIRRGDSFIPKAYKNSMHSIPIMKIVDIKDKNLIFTNKRYDE